MIDYEVYARRLADSDLLMAAIETHQAMLGRTPHLVAADAAFYSARNEAAAKAAGVKRVCIPPRAPSASASRRSAGSATARNGALGAKDASVWSSGDTDLTAADTRLMLGCCAGSASV